MKRNASILAAILLSLFARTTLADMYVKIDGISGPSKVAGHENAIKAIGINLDVVSTAGATGAEARKPKSSIGMVFDLDPTTSDIADKASTGKHISNVEITIGNGSGSKEKPVLTLTLSDVIVSKMQIHTDPTKPGAQALTPVVDVTFEFQKIEWKWTKSTEGATDDWNTKN
jgi:type VI secretion system Hcp family effector